MSEELRAGDGTVIRRTDGAVLAELRVLLEVASRLGTDEAWRTASMAASQAVPQLLGALPTLHDPSDREEHAYADGQRAALELVEAWLSDQQGMHRDTLPTATVREFVARLLR